MTLLPLTDCCLLLGVDPKTLRLWLKAAHLCWTVHPSDARLKCLTQPQLAQLAQLHGRSLPSLLPQAGSPAAYTGRFFGEKSQRARRKEQASQHF